MNYIVFDLEWNQAADIKTRLKNELMFEIIEIGAVKLDSRKNYVDCFHELIKPQIFHDRTIDSSSYGRIGLLP